MVMLDKSWHHPKIGLWKELEIVMGLSFLFLTSSSSLAFDLSHRQSLLIHQVHTRTKDILHSPYCHCSSSSSSSSSKRTCLQMNFMGGSSDGGMAARRWAARKDIKLPLLLPHTNDDNEQNYNGGNNYKIPLPSCSQKELSTTHYTTISTPVHKLLIQHSVENNNNNNNNADDPFAIAADVANPIIGSVAYKKEWNSWIGAIGTASEIIIVARNDKDFDTDETNLQVMLPQDFVKDNDDDSSEWVVLFRGNYRFIVKEIIQTYPFPIAIVDELIDGTDLDEYTTTTTSTAATSTTTADTNAVEKDKEKTNDADSKDEKNEIIEYNDFDDFQFYDDDNMSVDDVIAFQKKEKNNDNDMEDEEEEEEEDDEIDNDVAESDLLRSVVSAVTDFLQSNLDRKSSVSLSPLEMSILQQNNISTQWKREDAEETLATWQVFLSELLDIAPTKQEQQYVVAMMAAELAQVPNHVRTKALVTTDPIWRLRYILKQIKETIGMEQAKQLTQDIVKKTDESSKDLKIGTPQLPSWAKFIRKGIEVEYYWNEELEWCRGKVIEDPVFVLKDEMVVTVLFDDGETHKLPFNGDQKARWRPV